MSMNFRTTWLPRILLVVLASAAYCTHFDSPFIFDDHTVINDNPHMRSLWPPIEAMRWLPKSTASGRPLVAYSLAINFAISGYDVWSYHVFNLLVHLANVLLVHGLLRLTLAMPAVSPSIRARAPGLAVAITAIWAVHPINSEVVIYMIQRTVLMSAFFMLLSVRLLIAAHRSPRPLVWQALTVFAIVLGILCKEKVAVMPILLLLYDRTFLAGSFKLAWRRRRWMYVAAACTWALSYGTLTYVERGGIAKVSDLGWRYLLTQGLVICRYVWQMVVPWPLAVTYDQPLVETVWQSLPWTLLVLAGLIATCWALVRRPVLGFAGAWFYLILSPDSSIIPIMTEVVAERRMYLPGLSVLVLGVPLLAMAIRVVSGWLDRPANPWPVLVGIAVAATGTYTAATLIRAEDYNTDLRLWQQTLRAQPASSMALNNLAVAHMGLGQLEAAEQLIEELEAKDPLYLKTPALWAGLYFRRQEYENARVAYEEAVRREPANAALFADLTATYMALDDMEAAERTITTAMGLAPTNGKVLVQFAKVLDRLGRHEDALEVLTHLLEQGNEDSTVMLNAAVAANHLGRVDQARGLFEQALDEVDDSPHLLRNFADFEAQHGNLERAEELYREALGYDGQNVEAAVGLAMLLREQERYEEAEQLYVRATRVKPNDPILRNNFGVLLASRGRVAEAVEQFQYALVFKPDYEDARVNLQKAQRLLESRDRPASDPPAAESTPTSADPPAAGGGRP